MRTTLAPTVEQTSETSFKLKLSSPLLTQPLELRVTSQAAIKPPTVNDWAVLAMLPKAMKRGDDIFIAGAISTNLFSNIENAMAALEHTNPDWKSVTVTSETISQNRRQKISRRAVGFSGGVDCFATLARYTNDPGRRITDLTHGNVGTFGNTGDPDVIRTFQKGLENTKRAAKTLGLNWISIESNFDEAMPEGGFDFLATLTLRNAIMAGVTEGIIDEYLYSSAGYRYSDVSVGAPKGIAGTSAMDPVFQPITSTDNMRITTACHDLVRTEKIKLVTEFPMSFSMLDVCILTGPARQKLQKNNCSRCYKCKMTLLALDALGRLENYNGVFDLDHYAANKHRYLESAILDGRRGNSMKRELVKTLARAGWPIPSSTKIWTRRRLRVMKQNVRRAANVVTGHLQNSRS